MADRTEISEQEVAFFRIVRTSRDWMTASDIAKAAGIAPRTGRAYALKFVRLGMLDHAEVWPAHRYRWSGTAAKRNNTYIRRLEQADAIFAM